MTNQINLSSIESAYIKEKLASNLADTCVYFINANARNVMETGDELAENYTRAFNVDSSTSSPSEVEVVNLEKLASKLEWQKERLEEWQNALDSLTAQGIEATKKVTADRSATMAKVKALLNV
tara:strand:- start:3854 stop:4222 length:369 start_codon:yes stop_codon:yes gene_type:complete